jgi:hypothetical protein
MNTWKDACDLQYELNLYQKIHKAKAVSYISPVANVVKIIEQTRYVSMFIIVGLT